MTQDQLTKGKNLSGEMSKAKEIQSRLSEIKALKNTPVTKVSIYTDYNRLIEIDIHNTIFSNAYNAFFALCESALTEELSELQTKFDAL